MPQRDNERAESQGHLPSSRTFVHVEQDWNDWREDASRRFSPSGRAAMLFVCVVVLRPEFSCFSSTPAGNILSVNSDRNCADGLKVCQLAVRRSLVQQNISIKSALHHFRICLVSIGGAVELTCQELGAVQD